MAVDWMATLKYAALYAFLLLILTGLIGMAVGGNIVVAAVLSAILGGIITGVLTSFFLPRETSGGLTDVEATGILVGALLFALLALVFPQFNVPVISQGAMIFTKFATEATASATAAAAPAQGFNLWSFLLLFVVGVSSGFISELTQRAVTTR